MIAELADLIAGKTADQLVFTTQSGHLLRLPNWRREVLSTPASKQA
jgi:hypothetical protein